MSLGVVSPKIESPVKSEMMRAFEDWVNESLSKIKLIDFIKALRALKTNADTSANILAELSRKNINSSVFSDISFPEVQKLYFLCTQQNLPFGELLEDSLKLFEKLEYESSKTYLELLNKRQDRTLYDLKEAHLPADLLEKIKTSDIYTQELFQAAIQNYTNGTISLSETEQKILKALKKNRWLTNKKVSKQVHCSERTVESNCAKIRERFGLDHLPDKNSKRQWVIELAQKLPLD
jgi:DNA-binding CsgD family transcriptional regulator